MNYYISDLHLDCKSVLREDYDNRPYKNMEDMHNDIIEKWNKKVGNGDHVYILGDVSSKGYNPNVVSVLAQLKGSKHLILGNHDDIKDLRIKQQFVEICDYKEITDTIKGKSYKLVLSHYPILMWNGQHRGWFHLYGHTHSTYDEEFFQKSIKELNKYYKERDGERYNEFNAYNVGCMFYDYTPVTLNELLCS